MRNRLKEVLDERGIKQNWLAAKCEVSRNTITNIINGSTPSLDLAYKIAHVRGSKGEVAL